ncbi:MAG: pseudouridine synthase [Bacteroidota bacterium]
MSKQQRHFLLHKPYGYVSQFKHRERQRRNKKLLGDLFDFPPGTMAIGRLDKKSEGLLLLTTDGKVSERIRDKSVEKEYYVELDGRITQQAIAQLAEGVHIRLTQGHYTTLPCLVQLLNPPPPLAQDRQVRGPSHGPTSWVAITLREGKYRQVRKMTAAVGFPTLRLVRVSVGRMQIGNLQPGQVREVDELL